MKPIHTLTAAIAAAMASFAAQAATLTVDTADFTNSSDGLCALPEALINARNDAATSTDCPAGAGADTIVFDPALAGQTITFIATWPVGTEISISGAAAPGLTLSGGGSQNMFSAGSGGNLHLSDLVLRDGHPGSNQGGALTIANSTVTIDRVMFIDNTGPGGRGGAIDMDRGTLTIRDSTFSGNSAVTGGAILVKSATAVTVSNLALGTRKISGRKLSNTHCLKRDVVRVEDLLDQDQRACERGLLMARWRRGADTAIVRGRDPTSITVPTTGSNSAMTPSMPLPSSEAPRQYLWIWLLWLAAFYTGWLVLITVGDHWQTLADHWGIAVAMGLGSYVAGSTPMGGGTVGFPILVLLFDQPAQLGRDFSFAVQSIGMVSASIFILCRRQPIEWPMLGPSLVGALIGTPLGILYIAPLVPALAIKLTFAVIWCSFGVLHLYRTREFAEAEGLADPMPRFDRWVGFGLGFSAGITVAAITGVGIDMVLYATLVLLRRADLKIAIPSSVIIMGFTSLLGIVFKNLVTGVQPGVYENWLAAAPVVALGAPLGVFIVNKIGRTPTLYFVALLCIGQFVWTVNNEWASLGLRGLAIALAGVLAFNIAFELLHRWGYRIRLHFGRKPVWAQPVHGIEEKATIGTSAIPS